MITYIIGKYFKDNEDVKDAGCLVILFSVFIDLCIINMIFGLLNNIVDNFK